MNLFDSGFRIPCSGRCRPDGARPAAGGVSGPARCGGGVTTCRRVVAPWTYRSSARCFLGRSTGYFTARPSHVVTGTDNRRRRCGDRGRHAGDSRYAEMDYMFLSTID